MSWARLAAFVAASGALHASLGMVEDTRSATHAALGPPVEPIHLEFTIEDGIQLAPELPREPPPKPKPKKKAHESPHPPVVTPAPPVPDVTPPLPVTPPA